MSKAMSPTDVYQALHDAYLRYLETSFHLKDPSLLKQFRDLLHDRPSHPLFAGPYWKYRRVSSLGLPSNN